MMFIAGLPAVNLEMALIYNSREGISKHIMNANEYYRTVRMNQPIHIYHQEHCINTVKTYMTEAIGCLFLFLFLPRYWGLNPGPHTCKASSLPLAPCTQLSCISFYRQCLANFAQAGLEHIDPGASPSWVAQITGVSPHWSSLSESSCSKNDC
jgi:hypothetical protein